MMSFDTTERKNSSKILALLGVGIVLLITLIATMSPNLSQLSTEFSEGLGFKDAAIYSFFITIALLVVLTLAAGDGLIGELQFLLVGFVMFFFIIWLFIAWIF